MAAERKQLDEPESPVITGDSNGLQLMDVPDGQPSPVHALQERLSGELAGQAATDEPSVRLQITGLIIAAVASTWIGGYLLYVTL